MSQRSRAQSGLESVTDGLQDLIDSAEDLLSTLQNEKGEAVEALRERVTQTVSKTSRRLDALRSMAGTVGMSAARSTVKFAKQDPWRAIAIGSLVALGVYFLTRDRGEDEADEE